MTHGPEPPKARSAPADVVGAAVMVGRQSQSNIV
jgi:hypothetical protein